MKQLYKSLTDCENSNPARAEKKNLFNSISFKGIIKAKLIIRVPSFKARLKVVFTERGQSINQSLCCIHNPVYFSRISASLLVSNLTFNHFLTIIFQISFAIFVEESFF